MGLFDRINLNDISSKLNNLAQSAIDQGSSFVGSTKSNFRLGDLEKQLTKQYAELGKKYFEQIKDAPSQEDMATVTQIKDLLVQVEQEKAEARRLSGALLCPSCGAEVPAGTVYCSKCGAVVPQPGVVQSVICPGCGASLPNGTQFCTSCGTNVSNVQPTASKMPLGQVSFSGGMISSDAVTPPQTMQPQTFAAPQTMQPAAAPQTAQQFAQPAPATVQPAQFTQPAPAPVQPAAPVTVAPNFLTKQPEPVSAAPQTMQPAAPAPVQPAAPVTVAPNFLTKQPEPVSTAPQTMQPAAPAPVQPAAPVTVAPNFLTKQPEPVPAAPAPVQQAPQTMQPAQPAPATQQPSGFPSGGPSGFTMDIDTSVVYGDTSGGLNLNK